MNVELRWFKPDFGPAILQMRTTETHGPENALGRAWRWTEWVEVPVVLAAPQPKGGQAE